MTFPKLVPLIGKWKTRRSSLEFLGSEERFGIALSDQKIARGSIQVSATISAHGQSAGIIMGYEPEKRSGLMVTIGGWHSAYSIGRIAIEQLGTSASALSLIGKEDVLVPGHKYEMKITVEGVVISLSVDGAIVLQHKLGSPLQNRQIGLYAYAEKQKLTIAELRLRPSPRKAFVVMPFREPFDTLFQEVIFPVAKKFNVKAERAKDIYRPGVIIEDIIDGLENSDVVIADVGTLTPDDPVHHFNPNVYYEVGYAHRVGTPLILLADERVFNRGEGLPFDIHHFRCIGYRNTMDGKKVVQDDLGKYLKALSDGV